MHHTRLHVRVVPPSLKLFTRHQQQSGRVLSSPTLISSSLVHGHDDDLCRCLPLWGRSLFGYVDGPLKDALRKHGLADPSNSASVPAYSVYAAGPEAAGVNVGPGWFYCGGGWFFGGISITTNDHCNNTHICIAQYDTYTIVKFAWALCRILQHPLSKMHAPSQTILHQQLPRHPTFSHQLRAIQLVARIKSAGRTLETDLGKDWPRKSEASLEQRLSQNMTTHAGDSNILSNSQRSFAGVVDDVVLDHPLREERGSELCSTRNPPKWKKRKKTKNCDGVNELMDTHASLDAEQGGEVQAVSRDAADSHHGERECDLVQPD